MSVWNGDVATMTDALASELAQERLEAIAVATPQHTPGHAARKGGAAGSSHGCGRTRHSVLLFSEEYVKITKGMFSVWTAIAAETAASREVHVLINREHWGAEEAQSTLASPARVRVEQVPFPMASTIVKRWFPMAERRVALRALRYVTGQALNTVLMPVVIAYLCWRLVRLRPAAVYSHNGGWPAGQLSRWIIVAAAISRVPARVLVVHSHPAVASGPARWLRAPMRAVQGWMIRRSATTVVAVSDSVRLALAPELAGVPIVRIHNGIRSSVPAKSIEKNPLPWHRRMATVGFVGALNSAKGGEVLLEAMAHVITECEAVLVGPDAGRLDAMQAIASDCPHPVSFLGYQEDVDAFLEQLDVLVVPSIAQESFGMIVLEGMRHAKPVICSDFGGMKEVVGDGESGLVVPANEPLALARAIDAVLRDPVRARAMGEAGYRRLTEHFSLASCVRQYDALVEDIDA